MQSEEISKIQTYMRTLFKLDTIAVVRRPKLNDSCEVMVGDEFIGIVFKDEEEGETSYHFEMCILDIDLPE